MGTVLRRGRSGGPTPHLSSGPCSEKGSVVQDRSPCAGGRDRWVPNQAGATQGSPPPPLPDGLSLLLNPSTSQPSPSASNPGLDRGGGDAAEASAQGVPNGSAGVSAAQAQEGKEAEEAEGSDPGGKPPRADEKNPRGGMPELDLSVLSELSDTVDQPENALIQKLSAAKQRATVPAADDGEDEEDADGDSELDNTDLPVGTMRGEWRWTGSVWRRRRDEGDPEREEISWWERHSVQERLSFDKYINCRRSKGTRHRPTLEGLPKRMKWAVNDYIVHQGNYVVLKKGPDQNRTQRLRNPRLLPPDGESVLSARPGQWGNCAVVGNSGLLRLMELNRAIDSHDTIVRINQAPTYGYSRRVGRKVTHRVLNRLWTRTYRNTGGVKKGTTLPIEKDLTFMVSRATSQEYELLVEFLRDMRPDVAVWYLTSRVSTGAGPLLMGYRERLCHEGYGPFKGLNVPSSGFVAIYMLLPLCDRVTVYGFGVEGMGTKKLDSPDAYGYHYYKGVGMRHVGDDVHCFDCEEKVLQQMGAEGWLDFCTYLPNNDTNSWACGCRHGDQELCRPPSRPSWLRESDDCDPGYDDCEDLKLERLKAAAERERRMASQLGRVSRRSLKP
uniref:Cmp-n-acetylneuraminate-beta-galactosamide-alpha--sialyltransferase 1 n=1 Tax=Tetraselmis sp. GSL018 TaxID=582737 RepID=A0A061SAX5_9CHLO